MRLISKAAALPCQSTAPAARPLFYEGKDLERRAKKETRNIACLGVGATYFPGPSPAKYCRQERA